MKKYLAYTRDVAAKTPPTRNRVIDFWRAVAIIVVVFGHWLAASIWIRADGEIVLQNALEWIPYAAWVTWLVQVMPVFFFVGGYANGRALEKHKDAEYADWITTRARRLFTPVIPLVVVWTLLIVVLGPFLPNDVVRAGAMSATVPLWFIAVYISLTAVAPTTHRWWERQRWWSFAILCGAAVTVDVVRFGFDVSGVGWLNFLFVWAAIHQLGYWWASRDLADRPIASSTGLAVLGISLAVLIAVTWIGWYPVAMVGVPGAETTNMTPPTFAMALLGFAQAGIIWASADAIGRLAHRARVWHGVVMVSGVIMTIYLWHLTAMTLAASVLLFAFDGAAFKIEPGTTVWWLTRPLWAALLVTITLGLVFLFAPFEWRINRSPGPSRTSSVVAGVLLMVGSAAAISYFGLATETATVNWIIPIAAVIGALLVGAYPPRRRTTGGGADGA